MFVVEVNMVTNSASWVLDTDCGAHICNDLQVLQRSRKLRKNEVVLRLGDGKVVTAEAVGIISLVARGGFSYFITFTDAHSRYDYVYLMRYKSEAFVRFKEFRLEVENQTGRKIKTLRSNRGGEYLSGEFINYVKKKGIVSQWTPPGTPQLNGVAERRNRTLLDIIRSMMSFTELPLSFWGYALETAASPAYVKRLVGEKLDLRSSLCRFLGYPKETIGYYFYDPSEQKVFVSRNAVFLERGFPTDTRRDELLLEESSEAPQSNTGTLSAPTISTDNVPILGKWIEAMKSEMDSMSSNQVWTLVDRPKGVRPVRCKWVYKRKIGANGEVTTFKIDVKKAFLNGFVEGEIYIDQPEGFTVVGKEQKVCHLQRSIYSLKQASRSWNICFDEVIWVYDFVKNNFDPCVYKKVSGALFCS
ncbi:Retrovirus-related Pol polyprotein from transposon TNT 1-94 [Sesamum angolense]|uniref:Retrovirus-related Pol polyprotein from transposon TNT 1-94 n=1 Tax=Sesamum angolense TaxID=2727404 RepID=A0AAE2BU40_9LAMI|nr:Retrovirus-related Pol polyprotein from transposon TNT 1-94 [Sesamum angolense]